MAWDPDKPAGSQKLRLSDDDIRANNAAIEVVFGTLIDGAVAITSSAAELNLLDGVTAFKDEDNMASNSATSFASQQSIKAYVDTQIASEISSTILSYVTGVLNAPAGTVLPFGQSSAPTGWTRLTTGDAVYDAAADNAMFCFAKTGNIAPAGGGVNPQATHGHQWYNYIDASNGAQSYDSGGSAQNISGTNTTPNGIDAGQTGVNNYRLNSDWYTTQNTAPYYVEMILAKKDA